MTKSLAALLLFLSFGSCAFSQDTLAGYASTVSGESIGYASYTPMARTALLTRASTGQMGIVWRTVAAPIGDTAQTLHYVWVGGFSVGTAAGGTHFDLAVDGKPALTLTLTREATAQWRIDGRDGIGLSFVRRAVDKNGDVSGEMTLDVPRKLVRQGAPLTLSWTGRREDTQDWLMVYQYRPAQSFVAEVLPLLWRTGAGDTVRGVKIYGEYRRDAGSLEVRFGNAPVQHLALHRGYQEFLLPAPYPVRNLLARTRVDDGAYETDSLHLPRLIPLEIHLIHHSHTDIGYSALQEQVARIQNHNISEAIRLIEKTKDYPYDAQYRWNVESLWAVENFLDSAGPAERKAFAAAVKTGRMSLQALYANELTGLMDGEELDHLTEYARRLDHAYGIDIRTAMITDVPGYTWSTIAALQKAGIRYFSVGPNAGDRIGHVLEVWGDKPFWWALPGDRGRVLTDMASGGYSYFHGCQGSAEPMELTRRLLAYTDQLNKERYPYRYAHIRYNIVSDNAPLDTGISDFVRDWNERYVYPKLVLSTPEIVLSDIERDYGNKLPVFKGDLTPYWEDGAASTARELGQNRLLRDRLEQDEALAVLEGKNPGAPDTTLQAFNGGDWYRAWRGVVMFDEHTWGAWCSITAPDSPFTKAQWAFKKSFLTDADSIEKNIRRSLFLPATPGESWGWLNTHSWPISTLVQTSGPLGQKLSDGTSWTIVDSLRPFHSEADTLSSYVESELRSSHVENKFEGARSVWPATASGYRIENHFWSARIDSVTGGLASLVEKRLGADLVAKDKFVLNQFLYVPGRDPANAQSARLQRVDVTDNGPFLTVIRAVCATPEKRSLVIEYRFDNVFGTLTITDEFDKARVRTKEAVHFAFPFHLPGALLRADDGNMAYDPFRDTLAGGNRDFGYVGKWLDLSTARGGVTLISHETPIVEWGAMRSEVIPPGAGASPWKRSLRPTQRLFIYAMNNYWHTNYKADQEGPCSFTFTLVPHGHVTDADCYRFALEATQPVLNVPMARFREGLVKLDNPAVMINGLEPDGSGFTVKIFNASAAVQDAMLQTPSGRLELKLRPYETRSVFAQF